MGCSVSTSDVNDMGHAVVRALFLAGNWCQNHVVETNKSCKKFYSGLAFQTSWLAQELVGSIKWVVVSMS